MWNRDASRLAFHLAGDVGLRDAANGFTGIGLCPEINSDVADRAKAEIAAKIAKKARKTSLSAAGRVMASDEGDLRAEYMQQNLSQWQRRLTKERTRSSRTLFSTNIAQAYRSLLR